METALANGHVREEELSIDELAERNRAATVAEIPPEPEPPAEAEAPAPELPRFSADALRTKAARLEERILEFPELEGSVKVRGLKLSERNEIDARALVVDEEGYNWGEAVVLTIITGTIEPNLTEDMREWVEGLDNAVANQLHQAIRELSGMDKASREAAARSFRD